MPTPNLLHKTPVYIRQIDRSFTVMDDNLREPIGQVRREKKPIKLIAQVKIGDTDDPDASEGGVTERSAGYLLFRTQDLRAAEVELQRGDRVVQIGDPPNDRETDYYLTKFQWRGHYPEHGGPTLLKAFFADRKPSRQRGDL
jgi:hypothetical protein